jgi:hypothetical protein
MEFRLITRWRLKTIFQTFVVLTCVSFLVFAFVFEKLKAESNHSLSGPIKIGVDTSEIYRYANTSFHNEKLNYYTYLPNKVNDSMQVMFVMHGTDRNAMDYLDAWKDFANANNYLIVAPAFLEVVKDESFDYQEGNVWDQNHVWNNKEDWAFMAVERIFGELVSNNALVADSFLIFGHSAGAQFVHRMVLFMPESRIKMAFAANAGWYTFPNYEEKFPYGLMNTSIKDQTLSMAFQKKLFVLLGEEDKAKDHLRQTENANKQGKTRIERGSTFFKCSGRKATAIQSVFNWERMVIKHAAHNYIQMSKEAQKIILMR